MLIFQNDELNRSDYPTTIIIPFSTSLIDDAEPIRMRIFKKDKLLQDSDLIITQIRAIDNSRLLEKIGSLNMDEMKNIKRLFDELVEWSGKNI